MRGEAGCASVRAAGVLGPESVLVASGTWAFAACSAVPVTPEGDVAVGAAKGAPASCPGNRLGRTKRMAHRTAILTSPDRVIRVRIYIFNSKVLGDVLSC
jgi:hypothetical protein